MNRTLVALAVATSIPPSVWADEDPQTIVTALEIVADQEKAAESGTSARASGPTGPQYSG